MRDFNVLNYVGSALWAITDDKMAEIIPALIRHAKGDKLDPEQMQAFMGRDDEPPAMRKQGNNVAIVPVRGVIAHRMEAMSASSGGASCEAISSMLRQAFADESVGTVVLDVDSGGGTVQGVPELVDEIQQLKGRGTKQLIAMINGIAGSAALWIASQADEIVCIPSGEVGSIGVFSVHKDLSAALAKEGITITLIKAGKFKTEGNPFEPLSEETRARVQDKVDEAYALFEVGLNPNINRVRSDYGEGRMLTAKEAKAAGLIDRIGTMDETLSRLVGKSSKAGMRAEADEPEPEPIEPMVPVASTELCDPFDDMRSRLDRY